MTDQGQVAPPNAPACPKSDTKPRPPPPDGPPPQARNIRYDLRTGHAMSTTARKGSWAIVDKTTGTIWASCRTRYLALVTALEDCPIPSDEIEIRWVNKAEA